MNPYRNNVMKIKYTMSEDEIKEACVDWITNRESVRLEISDINLSFDFIGDSVTLKAFSASAEIDDA